MKINNLLIVIITFLFFSCSTQKSFKKVTQSIEVALPFQDVKSDKDFFRSVQMGKSSDLASAKKIASMNAKEEMTSNIQSVLKSVSDIYTNQVTNDDRIEYRSMFESLIRESSVQLLSNVQVKDEKVFGNIEDDNFLPLNYGLVAQPGVMKEARVSLGPGLHRIRGIPCDCPTGPKSGI